MPELPEVETVAADLRRLIVSRTIVAARCDWPRTIRTHEPEAFAAAIVGRTIERVGRRGKQLLVELCGDAVLTVHLKMTGQLFVVPAVAPSDRHVHLVLSLDDGRELRFRDIRKFGRVGLYARDPQTGEALALETARGDARAGATDVPARVGVFAGHGPEPLAPEFTLAAFRDRLHARRGRLKPLLLDQSFVAGIGNIYADEALWAARLHPLRSAASLRPWDEARLHAAIRTVLSEAVEFRGSSVDDYTAPDGDGSMQERLRVYQRSGEPCLRCGRPIRRIVVGGRATHFCSWCQRLPSSERPALRPLLAMVGRDEARRESRPGESRGPRWTTLDGEGALGLTPAERRRQATRRAAATRRARARGQDRAGAPVTPGPTGS